MSFIVQGIAVLVGLSFIIIVIAIMKRRLLTEIQSIGWLFGGLTIIILGLFPNILWFLANLFGVWYAPTMVTILAIVLIFLILFHDSIIISRQTNQLNELAMQVSLLKHEVEERKKAEQQTEGGDFY